MSFNKVPTKQSSNFMLDISLGKVKGMATHFSVGHTQPIATGVEKTLWDNNSLKVPISVAANIFASSTSASDTGGATILCNALDENYNTTILSATLTGQSQVQLTNIIGGGSDLAIWVQSAVIQTVGALGNVYVALSDTLTAGVPDTSSTIQSLILFPNNVTRNGFYMVPNGKIAAFTAIRGGTDSVSKVATINASTTFFGQPPIRGNEYIVGPNWPGINLMLPFASTEILGDMVATFPERTAIEYIGNPVANNTVISVGFDLIVLDEELAGF